MAIEDGAWIMRGLDWGEPSRIQNWEELIGWIDEVGFLPLFKNEVDGFSAEENTSDLYWWTGDEEQDPWEWRRLIARSGDFDSRWDEELATMRQKRIIDQRREVLL